MHRERPDRPGSAVSRQESRGRPDAGRVSQDPRTGSAPDRSDARPPRPQRPPAPASVRRHGQGPDGPSGSARGFDSFRRRAAHRPRPSSPLHLLCSPAPAGGGARGGGGCGGGRGGAITKRRSQSGPRRTTGHWRPCEALVTATCGPRQDEAGPRWGSAGAALCARTFRAGELSGIFSRAAEGRHGAFGTRGSPAPMRQDRPAERRHRTSPAADRAAAAAGRAGSHGTHRQPEARCWATAAMRTLASESTSGKGASSARWSSRFRVKGDRWGSSCVGARARVACACAGACGCGCTCGRGQAAAALRGKAGAEGRAREHLRRLCD